MSATSKYAPEHTREVNGKGKKGEKGGKCGKAGKGKKGKGEKRPISDKNHLTGRPIRIRKR